MRRENTLDSVEYSNSGGYSSVVTEQYKQDTLHGPSKIAPYLSTSEAAEYLNRSVSWLLRQSDLPYLPGKPNTYSRSDLDAWFDANKYTPPT